MFARRLEIDIVTSGGRRACPLDWLDQFAMRNFTRSAEFDDTLPISDGVLEAGFRVDLRRLSTALSEWLTRRGKGEGGAVQVEIREASRSHDS